MAPGGFAAPAASRLEVRIPADCPAAARVTFGIHFFLVADAAGGYANDHGCASPLRTDLPPAGGVGARPNEIPVVQLAFCAAPGRTAPA